MVTGLCFFISIFFSPIFASIPAWATGPVLVLVGSMMARACTDINWRYIGDAVPAFITLALMPFTYSIAYGLIGGICTYAIINTVAWILVKVSKGRLAPADYELKDPWTYKIKGGILPAWIKRAARGKRDFWRSEEDSEFEAQRRMELEEKRDGSPAYDVPHALTGDKEWEPKTRPETNASIGEGETRHVTSALR